MDSNRSSGVEPTDQLTSLNPPKRGAVHEADGLLLTVLSAGTKVIIVCTWISARNRAYARSWYIRPTSKLEQLTASD